MLKRLTTGTLGSIMALITGSTMAQGIAIFMQLALRRIYEPGVFGAYAICLSVVEIMVAIGTLRYENAIVLPEKDEDAANLLGLSIGLSLVINLLFLVIFLIFNGYMISWLNFPPEYAWWFMVIPVISTIFSFYQSINYWLIRAGAFRALSWNKMWRRGVEGFVQFLVGLFRIPVGMLVGTLGGHLVNVTSGIWQMRRKGFVSHGITVKGMQHVMYKYAEFAKYGALPALLNTFSALLPVFMVNKFYSHEITGYFDLSRQVLLVPVALIAASIAQVFTERFVSKRNKKEPVLKELFRTYGILLIISLVIMAIVIPFGPQLFGIVFGKNGVVSGDYARILVFALPIKLIASSSIQVFVVFEKIKTGGVWQAFYFFAILSLSFIHGLTIQQFLMLYALIETLCFMICVILIIRIVKRYEAAL